MYLFSLPFILPSFSSSIFSPPLLPLPQNFNDVEIFRNNEMFTRFPRFNAILKSL